MEPLLELDPGMPMDRAGLVEVAVDAPAGPGPRTWTYALPADMEPLEPGEAVLVPFGRGDLGARQAIGIVMGPGSAPERGEVRPVAARIRSDGPLLPPLSLALAGWIAAHYLAPVAVVIRAMLPPGLLEKVELVAEVTPAGEARLALPDPGLPPVELDLLDELAGRARPVRDLGAPEGRAGLLRRLRSLAAEGLVELTWTLLGAAIGPRYERRLWLTPEGAAAAALLAAGERPPGRPLGPRQRGVLAELAGIRRRRSDRRRPAAAGDPVGGRRRGSARGRHRPRRIRSALPRRRSPSATARPRSPGSSVAACFGPRSASVRAGPSRAGPREPAAHGRPGPRSRPTRPPPSGRSWRRSQAAIPSRSCSTG